MLSGIATNTASGGARPLCSSARDRQGDYLFIADIRPCHKLRRRTTRKPRLLLRLPGELLLRFATRQFVAVLFQLPPRFTRLEPDDGHLICHVLSIVLRIAVLRKSKQRRYMSLIFLL